MSATIELDMTKFNPSLFGQDEPNVGGASEVSVSPDDSESKDVPIDLKLEVHSSSGSVPDSNMKGTWNKTDESDDGNDSSNHASPERKYSPSLSSQSEYHNDAKLVSDDEILSDRSFDGEEEGDSIGYKGDMKKESDESYEEEEEEEEDEEDEEIDDDIDDEDDIPLQLRVQKHAHGSKKKKRNELSDELSRNPDLYGVRRSGRIKDNKDRLRQITSNRRTLLEQARSKGRNKHPLAKTRNSWSSSEDSEESEESSGSSCHRTKRKNKRGVSKQKRKPLRPQRIAGGRACTAGKTYKEVSSSDFSDEEPGIDDITENSDDSSQSHTDYSTSGKQRRGKNRDSSVASAYCKPSNKIHPLLQSGRQMGGHLQTNQRSRYATSGPTSFSRVRRLSHVGSQRSEDGEDDGNNEDHSNQAHAGYYSSELDIIDRVVDYRLGRKHAVGDATTIYLMRQRSDPNEGFNAETEKDDAVPQYLIKWKDWSHLHNTWESMDSLSKRQAEGLKKVERFNQKLKELSEWKMSASPEEIEEYNYQEEQNMHLYEQYRTVERVILHRDEGSDGTEYQVKWMGLPYAESSWEAGWVVEDLFPQQVEDYRLRSRSTNLPTPRGSLNGIQMRMHKHRHVTRSLRDQPKYIGNPDLRLRDYQLEGINFLLASFIRGRSVILADEMGLGKTIQTIGFLSVLFKELNIYGPFLLVVPLSTVSSWQKEFAQWTPFMNTICYLGDRLSREKIRLFEWYVPNNRRVLRFNACITTYEILMADRAFLSQIHWAALAVDEAHRLKNDESILYQHLFNFTTHYRLLITGTPLQNSLRELWALLHFLMPNQFPDWREFNDRYSIEKASDCLDLWKVLAPYIIRRVKKQVESSLPAKVEKILRVELSRKQKQYYKWILTKNYDALSKGVKGSITGFVNIVMELKKLCNHPYLVRSEEESVVSNESKLLQMTRDSGKMLLLDKLLLRLRSRGHRVLIFSQMVRMLDILEDYLRLRGWHFQRLDGSVRGDMRKNALDHFNAENSLDFVFLLSTKAGGLGINLATADTVIIFDSDWNPQNDLQAQARAHRIGQTKQVSVYRLVQTGSVEETIIERAKKKMVLDHLVIQRMDTTGRTVLNKKSSDKSQPFNKEELNQILKFGAEEMFKENTNDEEEAECPDLNIDDILNEAETREVDDENNKSNADELLSFFQVHNFTFDDLEEETTTQDESRKGEKENTSVSKSWDDIIPEEQIKLKREEENQAFLEQLNLGPRNRKQTKLFNYGQDDNEDDDDDDDDEDNDDNDGSKRWKMLKDKDLRALVRAIRRFPRPLDRVDAIITASERLQELSVTRIRTVISDILQKCKDAISKWQDEEELRKNEIKDSPCDIKDDDASKMSNASERKDKKKPSVPTIEIGQNVTVNAKQIVQCVNDLEPLAKGMPTDHAERLKYQLPFCPKPVIQWKTDWSTHDDAQLLVGVYEHGMDSWDSIKMDPELSLMDKILPPNGKHRPQANHLKTRVEYLIKLLGQYQQDPVGFSVSSTSNVSNRNIEKKSAATPKKRPAQVSSGPPRKKLNIVVPSGKSKEFIENSDISSLSSSSDSENESIKPKDSLVTKKSKVDKKETESWDRNEKKPESKKKRPRDDENVDIQSSGSTKKIKKEPSGGKTKKKSYTGPMHFTTHEPVLVKEEKKSEQPQRSSNEDETLSTERFKELKDVMRPVRKILKRLEKCNLEDESRTMDFVLRLGNHIRDIYHQQTSVEEVRRWRNDLWQFVSFFVDCSKEELHNMYKRSFKAHKEKGEDSSKRRHSRSSDDKKEISQKDDKSHSHRSDYSHHDRDHEHRSTTFKSTESHPDQSSHRSDSNDSRFHSHYKNSHSSSISSDFHHHYHNQNRDTGEFHRNSSNTQRPRPSDSYNRLPHHWSASSSDNNYGYGSGYNSDPRWRHGGGGNTNSASGGNHRGPPTDAYNSYRRPGHSGVQRGRWS